MSRPIEGDPQNIKVDTSRANKVAGLYLGMSKVENIEAINLAHEAGFIVSIVPTTPGTHPELYFHGREMYGMDEIRKALITQPKSDK